MAEYTKYQPSARCVKCDKSLFTYAKKGERCRECDEDQRKTLAKDWVEKHRDLLTGQINIEDALRDIYEIFLWHNKDHAWKK